MNCIDRPKDTTVGRINMELNWYATAVVVNNVGHIQTSKWRKYTSISKLTTKWAYPQSMDRKRYQTRRGSPSNTEILDIPKFLYVTHHPDSENQNITLNKDPDQFQHLHVHDWQLADCHGLDLVAGCYCYCHRKCTTAFVVLNSLLVAYYHRWLNDAWSGHDWCRVVGFPVVNRYVWGPYENRFVLWNRTLYHWWVLVLFFFWMSACWLCSLVYIPASSIQ